jgi:hypothetical protein
VVVLKTGTVKTFNSRISKRLKNCFLTSAVRSSDKKFVGTIIIPPSQSKIDNIKALYKSSTPYLSKIVLLEALFFAKNGGFVITHLFI